MLEIQNVGRSFGGVRALDGVTFNVNAGEILSIIGPNGAGKTTLFNVISGVVAPDSGDVRFEGRSIVGRPSHLIAARGVGRTYQVVRPFERLSVVENVAVGALVVHKNLRAALAAAGETLDLVGLSRFASRPAGSLTLTQRKRLEVARALAMRPKLILLDEVMAGLTPSEIDAMGEFVQSLREHGVAAVGAVEHVMRVVMKISQRIVVLDFGKVIAEGTPQEIMRNEAVIAAYFGTAVAAE